MTKILKRPLSVLLAVLMIAGIFTAWPLTAYAVSISAFGGQSQTISSDQTCTRFTVLDGSTLTVNQGVTLTLNISNGNNFNLFDNSTMQLHGTLTGSVASGAVWMDNTYINVYLSDGAKYTVTGLTCMDGDNYLRYYGYDAATDGNGTVSVKNGTTDVTSESMGYKTTTYTFTANPSSGYKFKNWTKGAGGEVIGTDASINVTCEDNGKYQVYANFEEDAPSTYTVTWKNGDTELEKDENVAKDATPEYNGATPTKAFDGKYYYDFKGWTPAITAVTGDATYTAVFEKADINYGEDNKISQDGTVDVSAADEGATKFGLNSQTYLNMQMLGVQKKSAIATAEGDNGIRFVTAVNTNLLKGSKIDDYGYIVVKAKAGTDTTKIYDKMNNLTYGAVDENVNVFSCKGKSNTISGDFGLYDADTAYKYITLAITGTDGVDATLAARFYIKTTDGKFYYADYIDGNNATHGGMAFDIASVVNNLV